jgi:hypothetical protein
MTLRSRHIKPLYTDEQKAELLLAGLNQNDIRPPSVALARNVQYAREGLSETGRPG